jgi:hypothetical protein
MERPRTGPCEPWTDAATVSNLPKVVTAATKNGIDSADLITLCGEAVMAASEILFEISGRMFTGLCGPVTCRPVSRPSDADTRSLGARLSPMGWFASWGSASSYGLTVPGVATSYAPSAPPTIKLPWPVREVLQVKIDGTVIPGPYDPDTETGEWELRDNINLVRLRPTASFDPTARYGWPTSQIADLPDTEDGTFSVTITFGIDPPTSGRLAAKKLAEFLVLPALGDTSSYPDRTTAITRQGVTVQVASVIDLLKAGSLGIYEIDAFMNAVNPNRNNRQAVVWSPDIGRARRQATVSLPSEGG